MVTFEGCLIAVASKHYIDLILWAYPSMDSDRRDGDRLRRCTAAAVQETSYRRFGFKYGDSVRISVKIEEWCEMIKRSEIN